MRVGLWVRVPNLATPDDAAGALSALQMAGFADAYVVSDGTPGNTVSLGVFADRAKAEQVAEAVRKAGFTPEMSDRLRTMDVVWLDIDRQANGGLPALEEIQPGAGTGTMMDMRACPVPAPGAQSSPPLPGAAPAA